MRKLIALITELSIVTAAIFAADLIQSKTNVIPRSIIHLPQVDYSRSDFWIVLQYFLALHLIAFAWMQFRKGAWIFTNAKRTSDEIFVLIAIYSISALSVFITTTVNFDPDFMAAIGICSFLLFLIIHIIASIMSGHGLFNALKILLLSLSSRLFRVSGVLILLIALTPPLLAYAFTSNRDVANIITQIRIKSSDLFSTKHQYSLVNATGGLLFKQPVLAKMAPGDSSTLYILERSGRLLALDYPVNDDPAPRLILDIQDKVGYVEIENGALGFAFHPDFGNTDSSNNGFIYIYYTAVHSGKQTNRISRFNTALHTHTDILDSETSLLTLQREPSGFHNGGSIEFGPEGYLYIAIGEGVRLEEKSQAKTLRQGILRIDIDQRAEPFSSPVSEQPINGTSSNYFIPDDNPFINDNTIRNEYWAIGLRNPFRISFDPKTGNLWAGDVGSTKWEEVNLILKGHDYQFPHVEGYEVFKQPQKRIFDIPQQSPVYTYLHTAYDRAVIGGVVYRGALFPELKGQYIYADNYSSKVFSMDSDKTRINADLITEIAKANQFAQRGISSVTQLDNGDILITTLGRSKVATGEVLKLSKGNTQQKSNTALNKANSLAIDVDEARQLFSENCSRCHGADGRGQGPDSSMFEVPIPDFSTTDFQQSRTDARISEVITKGGTGTGLNPAMPPWENILTLEEIKGLTRAIRGPLWK